MNLYRNESSDPKFNAQRCLSGLTHYVDDDTLRFHKSRIISTYVVDHGLLFALVESVALDMHNTKRGFRYVVFDTFGNVINRAPLDECYSTSKSATKAMWAYLGTVDAIAVTVAAIDGYERYTAQECADARAKIAALATTDRQAA